MENVGKRQSWKRGQGIEVEHIGIMAVPDDPTKEIRPAAGWQKLEKVLPRIQSLPGGRRSRIRAIQAYAKPLWSWASPLFALPPTKLVGAAMRAILSTRCTWWCKARFWCNHITLHPRFSAILVAVERITSWDICWSSFLEHNFIRFLNRLILLQHAAT